MSNIIVIGDLHVRDEEPFYSAAKDFFDWFIDQDFNIEENYLVQVGDLFHRNTPSPEENDLVIHWLDRVRIKKDNRYFLRGNHDFNKSTNKKTDSYSIRPLQNFGTVVSGPGNVVFNSVSAVFLPWMYESSLSKKTCNYYRKFFEENAQLMGTPDIVFYHFPDETQNRGNPEDFFDLSFFPQRTIRMGGDIHTQSKNYIGTPYPTRVQEAGQQGRLGIIDTESKQMGWLKVPLFLDFKPLHYGKDVPNSASYHTIFTILDAPSSEEAKRKYSGIYINSIKLAELVDRKSENFMQNDNLDEEDLKSMLKEFCTIKKVKPSVVAYLEEVFQL